ncbi:hypothetical protein SAMN03159290_04355 [Pseudomonas sp. NFACC13-1]|nr:hypothetical protein SAMN03159290_04355 [Pseudomonas sp. NFACC13-1]
MMSNSKNSSTFGKNQAPIYDPPTVVALPNIDGGETNLLHKSALEAPLPVTIPKWLNSDPKPHEPEWVTLYWGDVDLETKTWTAPVPDADRVFYVPVPLLLHGEHSLHYFLHLYNGAEDDSFDLTLTIDTLKPLLNQTDDLAQFPEAILTGGVTAQYLDQNNDQVKVGIPRYDEQRGGPKVGDIITLYLNEKNGTGEPDQLKVGELTVPHPVPNALEGVYEGKAFRDFGDRVGYARYRVQDRAGNISELSGRVELDVKAAPTPRDLSYPWVKEASGNPQASRLDPNLAAVVNNGVIVAIPQNAIISDTETAAVLFGEEGGFGFYRADTPIVTGGREYRIPKEYVARNLRKNIPIIFEVTGPNIPTPLESQTHSLTISSLSGGLPVLQSTSFNATTLSLANIPDGGAAVLRLGSWKYMATSQFLRVEMRGLLSAGGAHTVTILDAQPVTSVGEMQAGQILKTELRRFQIGEKLTFIAKVSFDNKQTWHDFPTIDPQLTN